jgi:hypothetical protein
MALLIGILFAYAALSAVVALLLGRLLRHGGRLAADALAQRETPDVESAQPVIEERRAA